MAQSTFVAGYCQISTDTGSARALQNLGVCINSVSIQERKFYGSVFSDVKGGEEGGPVDQQFFDQMDIITMDFSRFDAAVVEVLRQRMNAQSTTGGGTAGTLGTPGSLLIGGSYQTRLLIVSVGFTRNYPICLFHDPIEFGSGTKYTRPRLVATAYKNESTGVLWNTTAV